MKFEELKELIEQVDASSLKVFELDNEVISLKMSKNDGPLTTVAPVSTQESSKESATSAKETKTPSNETEVTEDVSEIEGHEVTAPIVGTAYRSPSPEKPPFVEVGDTVKKGQPLIIVEAMKVMNEIKSDVSGEVVEILVEDGQPIEYGQVLVIIKES